MVVISMYVLSDMDFWKDVEFHILEFHMLDINANKSYKTMQISDRNVKTWKQLDCLGSSPVNFMVSQPGPAIIQIK